MKIDKVDMAVNAIKAVKTVEIIGTAAIMTPVNVLVGAFVGATKGAYSVINKESNMLVNLWERKDAEA